MEWVYGVGTVYYVYLLLQTGMTALMEASKEGHIECVRALLRGGAKVNIKDNVST